MLAYDRMNAVGEILQKKGSVSAAELTERFGVSVETVRRDLREMESRGLLRRVHGGAVLPVAVKKSFSGLGQRLLEHTAEKESLSEKALSFVEEGDILCVDSGSTAAVFAERLAERFRRLTVVTYGAGLTGLLRKNGGIELVCCGGRYLRAEDAFYGDVAEENLRRFRVNKTFLFPSAVSLTHGLSDFVPELIPMQRISSEIADRVFVLADHYKLETAAFLKIRDLTPQMTVVTDPGADAELVSIYRENKIEVVF